MYQSQADDLSRGFGQQLNFNARRDDGYQNGVQSPGAQQWRGAQSPPYATSGGGSYPGSYPGGGRTQGGAGDEEEDYNKSVGEIRQMFNKPVVQQSYRGLNLNAEPGSTSYVPKRPVFQKPKPTVRELSEPGWIPRNKPSPHSQDRYAPSYMRSPPVNRRGGNDLQNYRPPPPVVYHQPAEKPAWLGSLRSSGGPKGWELQEQQALIGEQPRAAAPTMQDQNSAAVHSQTYPGPGGRSRAGGYEGRESPVVVHNPKVQALRYGPGGDAPVYEQRDASAAQDSDSARVAHLQYNSPIGLYSKQNALDSLQVQTKGKPGDGTLQITGTGGPSKPFNPNMQSDVYRMIQEEEEQRKRGGGGRPVSSGGPPARRPAQRRPSPPRHSGGDPPSARLQQLVNENSDQMDDYMRMPQHSTTFPGSYGSSRGGPSSAGRTIPIGHDAGISDF